MYCSKCGKELPEGSRFCPNCGNSVDFSTPLPAQTSSGQEQNAPSTEQPNIPPASEQSTPSAPQQNIPPVSEQDTPPVPNEEIKCPNCGASGCVPQYKQNVSGGGYGCCSGGLGALVLGPLGLLCGACGRSVKSTNTLVWICPKCGHEFRVQSKEEAKRNYMAGCLMMLLCALAVDVFLAYMGYDNYWGELMEGIKPLIIFVSVMMATFIAFIAYIGLYKKPPVKFTDEECQQLKIFTVVCLVITLAFGFAIIALF